MKAATSVTSPPQQAPATTGIARKNGTRNVGPSAPVIQPMAHIGRSTRKHHGRLMAHRRMDVLKPNASGLSAAEDATCNVTSALMTRPMAPPISALLRRVQSSSEAMGHHLFNQ